MDTILQQHFENLNSKDAELRYHSFQYIMNETKQPINWGYQVWDDMLMLTKTGDNHQKTIGVQVLSNLAKSDCEQRMLTDLDALIAVTHDEKFVTARHSLLSLWKVGIANFNLRDKVICELSKRFVECSSEKNCTLIRYDITVVFRKIFDGLKEENVISTSLALIETETDEKYKKKYLTVWKDVS